MSEPKTTPTIIKRKKVVSGGRHHGGAWKVAYADFVTAMMAFFMLMWLLNATTEKQRKGIADYFSPDIPVSRASAGGSGMFQGDSTFAEEVLARNGIGASDFFAMEGQKSEGEFGAADRDEQEAGTDAKETLESLEKVLLRKGGESPTMEQLLRHIVTRVSDEGLIVEIFDLDDAPLFQVETAEPLPILNDLVEMIAEVFGVVRNGVAINGHVRSYPIVLMDNPVWDLSSARAQAFRGLLNQITRATQGGPVSPAVVIALIGVESSGQSGAVSPKGAGGLMQLIPETAARFGVQDRFDPAQNIAGGVAYLNWLMATFSGDPLMVLAGYNAGEGAVTRHNGVPPFAETRAYVPKVLAAWQVARSLCLRPPLSFQDGCVIADVAAKDQSLGANASAQSR